MDFSGLSPTEFENLTFDTVQLLGLKNCVWRTPGSDVGRDIQGDYFPQDFSGYTRKEDWYVECKRYESSVAWPVVWEKIAYAEANAADVLLFVTSSSLSPQAVDQVNRWNELKKSPLIRFWNGTDLWAKILNFPQLIVKYGLSSSPITDAAVSLLPITKILTKYTNSAYAKLVFGGDAKSVYEVVQAVSELISIKIEQIEVAGKPSFSKFFAKPDGYEFVVGNDEIEAVGLDKYAIRSIFSILWFVNGGRSLSVVRKGSSLSVQLDKSLSSPIVDDLISIAFWGNFKMNFNPEFSSLEIVHE
jgi:hypothetical protein